MTEVEVTIAGLDASSLWAVITCPGLNAQMWEPLG